MDIDRARDPRRAVRDYARSFLSPTWFGGVPELGRLITAVDELRTTGAIDALADLRELFYLADVPDVPPRWGARREIDFELKAQHERLRERLIGALSDLSEPANQVDGIHRVDVLRPSQHDIQTGSAQTQRLLRIATEALSEAARAWALYHLGRTAPIATWPTLINAFKNTPAEPRNDITARIPDATWPSPAAGFERTRRCALAVTSALRRRHDRAVAAELWALVRDAKAEPQVRFWALASLSERPVEETFDFRVPTTSPLPAELRNHIVQKYLPGDFLDWSSPYWAPGRIHHDIDVGWLIERMHSPYEGTPSRLVDPKRAQSYDQTAAAVATALASAGYQVQRYEQTSEPYPQPVLEIFFPDQGPDTEVALWLDDEACIATISPWPNSARDEKSTKAIWARAERVAQVASDVATANGWYWLSKEMARTVLPRFHFVDNSVPFSNDDANPIVMDLLSW